MTTYRNRRACLDITPAGKSALRCVCGQHFSRIQEQNLLAQVRTVCSSCGEAYIDPSTPTATVNASSAYALTEEGTYAATWLHASTDENWAGLITSKPDLPVHVGDRKAAMHRMHDQTLRYGWADYYLYEIVLRPSVRIAKNVVADAEVWPEDAHFLRGLMCDGANRYVNAWESPGSISLLVPIKHLQVIGRKKITKEPAWRRHINCDCC